MAILGLISGRTRAEAPPASARQRLLSLVHSQPGIPVGELARRLDVRTGTLHYHLHRLELDGSILTCREGRRRLVFPASDALEGAHVRALGLLRGRTTQSVAEAILKNPGVSLLGVMKLVDETPRTVYYHVKRLREAGLISSASSTRYRDLRAAPLLEPALTLARASPEP